MLNSSKDNYFLVWHPPIQPANVSPYPLVHASNPKHAEHAVLNLCLKKPHSWRFDICIFFNAMPRSNEETLQENYNHARASNRGCKSQVEKYDLDAVHLNISWSCKHGELTTRASPVELFATDSTIVDESCNINILIGSLTSLVVGTKTAAVGLAVFVDGE